MSHDLKTLIANYGLACHRDGPSGAQIRHDGKVLDAALAALAPDDIDTRAERAAKALIIPAHEVPEKLKVILGDSNTEHGQYGDNGE